MSHNAISPASEIAGIYSVMGLLPPHSSLIVARPFRTKIKATLLI